MRLMIYSLRPQVLESVGLIGALQQRLNTVEQRAGMQTNLLVEGVDNLPTLIEDGLFRITQEALNNALKHASASSIIVRLEKSDQAILLEVSDNGVGFDRNNVIEGIGLSSMEERAKQIGGSLQIETSPGKGTVIRAIIDHKTIER
jgi:signal transduction histidine kinase